MTAKHFDFIIDRDASQMTIRRVFNAPRQLVWDCHTQSRHLDQWFAPKPMTTRTKTMDFRDGGHWHYAMVMPDGQAYWGRMDYQTIRPIDGYDVLDGFSDETGALDPNLPRATWAVSFQDLGRQTLVQTQVSYGSTEDLEKVIAMGMEQGMTSTMERLDELLDALTRP